MDHYEKKLEDIEENVRLEQSEVSLAGEVCRELYLSLSPSHPISPLFLIPEKLLFSSITVLILWCDSYISSQVLRAGLGLCMYCVFVKCI